MRRIPLQQRGRILKMTTPALETSTSSAENLLAKWMSLLPDEKLEFVARQTAQTVDRWTNDWMQFAYGHQKPPEILGGEKQWTTWLILGGRGAGKTRAGAEWVYGYSGRGEYSDGPVAGQRR